jgi:hypothetical protein
MHSPTKVLLAVSGLVLAAGMAAAQDPAQLREKLETQGQIQNIMRDRPREAEAAARAFLHVIGMKDQPPFEVEQQLRELDSLKARALDAYWMEVAQLTVQFDMVQQLVRRDSTRAELVTRMFGQEVVARQIQRAYRNAAPGQLPALRRQLEGLMGQHFDIENQLRGLEIADIERRLSQVRAETERRREKRGEFVKWAVDDIIRDATRPE